MFASVCLHGIGGRTVQTLRANDLHAVRDLAPDIAILEIGSNDLLKLPPQTVGSAIEDLVRLPKCDFSVAFFFRMLCRFAVTQRF